LTEAVRTIGCASLLFTLKKIYAIDDAGVHFKQSRRLPIDKALQHRVALVEKGILPIARRRGSLVLFNVVNYK